MPKVGPYYFRNMENAVRIVESSNTFFLLFNAECHEICQILDEYLKQKQQQNG